MKKTGEGRGPKGPWLPNVTPMCSTRKDGGGWTLGRSFVRSPGLRTELGRVGSVPGAARLAGVEPSALRDDLVRLHPRDSERLHTARSIGIMRVVRGVLGSELMGGGCVLWWLCFWDCFLFCGP